MYPLLRRSERGVLAGAVSIVLLLMGVGYFVALSLASASALPTRFDPILIFTFTHGFLAWVGFGAACVLCLVLGFYAACQLGEIEIIEGVDWVAVLREYLGYDAELISRPI